MTIAMPQKLDQTAAVYRGFHIVPKLDFGTQGFLIKGKWVKSGFVVTDGSCNIMPGATWFQTVLEAKRGIDIFISVKGNADRFWEVIQPFEFTHLGQRSTIQDGLVTKGRCSAVIENFVVVKLTSVDAKGNLFTLPSATTTAAPTRAEKIAAKREAKLKLQPIFDMLVTATAAARAIYVERAIKLELDHLEHLITEMKKVDMDMEKFAPYPNGRMGGIAYMIALASHETVRKHFTTDTARNTSSLRPGQPHYMVLKPAARANLRKNTTLEANALFDAFLYKQAAKIELDMFVGDRIQSATLTGVIWDGCVLTIVVRDLALSDRELVWSTKCILNRSIYHKLFNQWPTRRVS